MKSNFPGWYPKGSAAVGEIWANAIFVPDANVLLHCLRHSAKVRQEILRIFEVLKDSIWIPHQVGLEFHRNRLDVEFSAQDAYDRLTQDYEAALNQAREKLRQLRAHPTIGVERELSALNMFMIDFRARMEEAKEAHPEQDIHAAVERLTTLLDGRVGDKWPSDQLTSIKKEGEDRYARKVPPGYKDSKKDGDLNKFGDLIIWKDMISEAAAEKRPVIFISDDAKEDWWWIHRGRKLGPRPELVEEFKEASGQDFHLYEFAQFLRIAATRHPEIEAGVDEVEKSLIDDERARKRQIDAQQKREAVIEVTRLEDEREQVVALLSGTPTLEASAAPLDRTGLRNRLEQLDREIELLEESMREDSQGPSGEVA